jgi:hypothetical protein
MLGMGGLTASGEEIEQGVLWHCLLPFGRPGCRSNVLGHQAEGDEINLGWLRYGSFFLSFAYSEEIGRCGGRGALVCRLFCLRLFGPVGPPVALLQSYYESMGLSALGSRALGLAANRHLQLTFRS